VAGRRSGAATASAALALAAAIIGSACTGTTDSIGYNGTGGIHLQRLKGPATYPNAFRSTGKTDAQIAERIATMFAQLFYGTGDQPIYFPMGTDEAVIEDILHGKEIRTEGMGLAMMITVQMDKRTEFDRLWTYAHDVLRYSSGTSQGYFRSRCDGLMPPMTQACDDPYGEQQMAMALIFAHDRWGSDTGPLNYEQGAIDLLTVMRHKEDQNDGVVDGVTNVFDDVTGLAFDQPNTAAAGIGRPSIAMPAYYDLWAQATGDPFWTRAAVAARAYLQRSADPNTGLIPVKWTFAGESVDYWDKYLAESYRAQINMALDQIWTTGEPDEWEVDEANLLLAFFSHNNMQATYGATFTLDGTALDPMRDNALIAVNGVTAMIATKPLDRATYVNDAWNLQTLTGTARYYAGIMGLTSVLILSGQYIVW
jgi:oligosaccharide reducing-end xylanase